MGKVLDKNVHDIYQGLMANCFYTGKAIQETFNEFAYKLDDVLASTNKAAEAGLGEIKKIDDTFDKYIPGYSGFKQYNATFLILKSTYYYLKESNANEDIKQAAIERVEKAEREKLWKYATWQMKVNLIYNMRYDGAGMGGLTEERKENAIITVLKSCRHAYEFEKILEALKDPKPNTGREPVYVDELLDFEQQGKFDALNKKYGRR